MRCNDCGTENPDGLKFCHQCARLNPRRRQAADAKIDSDNFPTLQSQHLARGAKRDMT
jgi:hypothetical protein